MEDASAQPAEDTPSPSVERAPVEPGAPPLTPGAASATSQAHKVSGWAVASVYLSLIGVALLLAAFIFVYSLPPQAFIPLEETYYFYPVVFATLFGLALLPFGGIICGHVARRQIRRSDGQLIGQRLAIGGLVVGYLLVTLEIVLPCTYALLIVIAFSGGGP